MLLKQTTKHKYFVSEHRLCVQMSLKAHHSSNSSISRALLPCLWIRRGTFLYL